MAWLGDTTTTLLEELLAHESAGSALAEFPDKEDPYYLRCLCDLRLHGFSRPGACVREIVSSIDAKFLPPGGITSIHVMAPEDDLPEWWPRPPSSSAGGAGAGGVGGGVRRGGKKAKGKKKKKKKSSTPHDEPAPRGFEHGGARFYTYSGAGAFEFTGEEATAGAALLLCRGEYDGDVLWDHDNIDVLGFSLILGLDIDHCLSPPLADEVSQVPKAVIYYDNDCQDGYDGTVLGPSWTAAEGTMLPLILSVITIECRSKCTGGILGTGSHILMLGCLVRGFKYHGNQFGDLEDGTNVDADNLRDTNALIMLRHGCSLCAYGSQFVYSSGPAVQSLSRGTVYLNMCRFYKCGWGDVQQTVDSLRGHIPYSIRGEHPTVSIGPSTHARIIGCTFERCAGHHVQIDQQAVDSALDSFASLHTRSPDIIALAIGGGGGGGPGGVGGVGQETENGGKGSEEGKSKGGGADGADGAGGADGADGDEDEGDLRGWLTVRTYDAAKWGYDEDKFQAQVMRAALNQMEKQENTRQLMKDAGYGDMRIWAPLTVEETLAQSFEDNLKYRWLLGAPRGEVVMMNNESLCKPDDMGCSTCVDCGCSLVEPCPALEAHSSTEPIARFVKMREKVGGGEEEEAAAGGEGGGLLRQLALPRLNSRLSNGFQMMSTEELQAFMAKDTICSDSVDDTDDAEQRVDQDIRRTIAKRALDEPLSPTERIVAVHLRAQAERPALEMAGATQSSAWRAKSSPQRDSADIDAKYGVRFAAVDTFYDESRSAESLLLTERPRPCYGASPGEDTPAREKREKKWSKEMDKVEQLRQATLAKLDEFVGRRQLQLGDSRVNESIHGSNGGGEGGGVETKGGGDDGDTEGGGGAGEANRTSGLESWQCVDCDGTIEAELNACDLCGSARPAAEARTVRDNPTSSPPDSARRRREVMEHTNLHDDVVLEYLAGMARLTQTTDTFSPGALLGMAACRHAPSFQLTHARIIVNALQCGGISNDYIYGRSKYTDTCLCDGSRGLRIAQSLCRLIGGGGALIQEALSDLIMNRFATPHGRTNAATELAYLALVETNETVVGAQGTKQGRKQGTRAGGGIRKRAVDSIGQALCDTTNNLLPGQRASLLLNLKDLKASEVCRQVRSLFKKCMKADEEFVDRSLDFGYTAYLQACDLDVDLEDPIVAYEGGAGMQIMMFGNVSEEEQNRRLAKATAMFKSNVEAYTAMRESEEGGGAARLTSKASVCAECGRAEVDGKKAFAVCGGCHVPMYCSKECQRLHWNGGHKKICKAARKKRENAEVVRPALDA